MKLHVLGALALSVSIFSSTATLAQKPAAKGHKSKAVKAQKIVTLPSGLQYIDEVVGTGPSPTVGQTLSVNCTGRLTDSTIFWSTLDPKFGPVKPLDFQLGSANIIKGWNEGLATAKVGGRRKLIIPPSLAYGERGRSPGIPGNATLVFDITIVAIK